MTPGAYAGTLDNSPSLAEMLAAQLEKTGMTQRAVALQIGVSPQTIANILKGARPDVSTLHKLSQFLGEPVGLLMKLVGLTPSIDLDEEQLVSTLGDDWSTLKMLGIMRKLPKDRRKRLLQLAEIFVDDQRA
jgi:transcriptional regulator with XRE-family HTH domain